MAKSDLKILGRKYILLILISLCVSYSDICKAQLSISLSSTTSTCENNGSVTATVTMGSPAFSYHIFGPDEYEQINTSDQSSYTWSSLFPGNYKVIVSNENFSDTSTIEVFGHYMPLSLMMEVTRQVSCPGGSDGIITAMEVNGLGDFIFELYAGKIDQNPVFLHSQINNGVFEGLEAGTYSLAVIDSCQNQVVQTRILDESYIPLSLFTQNAGIKLDCETVAFNVENIGGKPPYQYRITSPEELSTNYQSSGYFELSVDNTGQLTFEVQDGCGKIANGISNFPRPGILSGSDSLRCSYYRLSFGGLNLIPPINYSLQFPDGSIQQYSNPPVIENAEYNKQYIIEAIDVCGEKASTLAVKSKFSKILKVEIFPDACTINSSEVIVITDAPTVAPVTLQILESPDTYTGQDTLTSSISRNIYFLHNMTNGQFGPGAYTVAMKDSCDVSDTISFDISPNDVLEVTLETEIVPECGDLNTLHFQLFDNSNAFSQSVSLFSIDSNKTIGDIILSKTGSYTNLLPGDYFLNYIRCDSDIIDFDTIHIGPTPLPLITSANQILCDDTDSMSIAITPLSGIQPYKYRLLSGPDNGLTYPDQWIENPIIGKYPIGENYRVQIMDKCGAIVGQDVSEELNILPEIVQDSTKCQMDTLIFRIAEPVQGIDYTWTLPNDSVAVGTSILYPIKDSSGTISVDIDVTACKKVVYDYTWDGQCKSTLPVDWGPFEVIDMDPFILLQWKTYVEVNNDYFLIERSSDGKIWDEIGRVDGHGNSQSTVDYDYKDYFRIPGSIYYRIKQIDYDGNFSYSPVKSVLIQPMENIIIYPNPAKNYLYIDISSSYTQEFIKCTIMNNIGQQVVSRYIMDNHIKMDISNLPKGIYFVVFESKNQVMDPRKIIIR